MYYLVIVQNNSIPAIFSYETYDAALAAFHTEMAYRHESRTTTKCAIVDNELVTLKRETYTAPVPDPNTEPAEG